MSREIIKVVPKIVQMVYSASQYSARLFALDDCGNLWMKNFFDDSDWERVEDLPEIPQSQSRKSP